LSHLEQAVGSEVAREGGIFFLAGGCATNAKHVKPVWHDLQLEDVRLKLQSAPNTMAMFEMSD
jgi:hypothetical protein